MCDRDIERYVHKVLPDITQPDTKGKKQQEIARENKEYKAKLQSLPRDRRFLFLALQGKTYKEICAKGIASLRKPNKNLEIGSLQDFGNRLLKRISFNLTGQEGAIDMTNVHIKIPELIFLETEEGAFIRDENQILNNVGDKIISKVNFQPDNSKYRKYHLSPYINTFVAERNGQKYFMKEYSLQKPISRYGASNKEMHKRWERENKILTQIKESYLSKNSLSKLVESFQNEEKYYIRSEFFSGKPLSNQMGYKTKSTDLFERKIAIAILKNLLQVIDRIHSINIVHRNIHPSNVWVDENNNITLTDFSYSKNIDGNATELEQGQTAIPGAEYLPPLLNGFPDRSVDFFSAALIFLRMVTGIETRRLKVLEQKTLEPSYFINKELSPLDKIIRRMVHCWSPGRYISAREILDDLEQAG